MTNAQTSKRPRMPRKEVVRLGKEIYRRDILPKVKDGHFGEFVAIDVATGDWEISERELDALDRLRERRPEAVDVTSQRVGFRSPVSFGGSSRSPIQ